MATDMRILRQMTAPGRLGIPGGTLPMALTILTSHSAAQTLTTLHSFAGGSDGANPYAGVVIGPNAALYDTTFAGGGRRSEGAVFKLPPPAVAWPTPTRRSLTPPWPRRSGSSTSPHARSPGWTVPPNPRGKRSSEIPIWRRYTASEDC